MALNALRVGGLLCLVVMTAGVLAGQSQTEANVAIDVHYAYGAGGILYLQGRLREDEHDEPARADDSHLSSLKKHIDRMHVHELKREPMVVSVQGARYQIKSDAEGYFALEKKLIDAGQANLDLELQLPKRGFSQRVRVDNFNGHAQFGVISDFDDTVIISDVENKVTLLKNALASNPSQRTPVAGVADLFTKISQRSTTAATMPMFFVTGSPRQIQDDISQFLQLHHFPPAVIITKKINAEKGNDPLSDQFKYKTSHISALLEQMPTVRFVLVGDDGEKDPEVYREIQRRYPAQVAAIWINPVARDVNRSRYPGQQNLTEVVKSASDSNFLDGLLRSQE